MCYYSYLFSSIKKKTHSLLTAVTDHERGLADHQWSTNHSLRNTALKDLNAHGWMNVLWKPVSLPAEVQNAIIYDVYNSI